MMASAEKTWTGTLGSMLALSFYQHPALGRQISFFKMLVCIENVQSLQPDCRWQGVFIVCVCICVCMHTCALEAT